MLNERKVFALKFRQFSESFKTLSPAGIMQNPMSYIRTIDDAGKLIVEAFRRSYLIHPRLAEIIDRLIDNPPPPPIESQCRYVPCASNVFFEVAGNHDVPVVFHPSGAEIVGPMEGGLIPKMYPGIVTGWPLDESATRELPHLSFVCDLLAEIVEYGDPAESRDKFIYDEAIRGKTWSGIMEEVNLTTGWESLDSQNGVKDRAKRYAEKHNLKPIPPRQSGRQKNMK